MFLYSAKVEICEKAHNLVYVPYQTFYLQYLYEYIAFTVRCKANGDFIPDRNVLNFISLKRYIWSCFYSELSNLSVGRMSHKITENGSSFKKIANCSLEKKLYGEKCVKFTNRGYGKN
jgi:hypothetical protein